MDKISITAVFGTRPEAIKMCPLISELNKRKIFDTRVCLTGQHGDMVKDTLKGFDVAYDTDLGIMTEGQTLFDITERIMKLLHEEFIKHRPHLVLVHGDTSTAFATALSSFYMNIPIGHVEAGLRTGNIHSPFPEEFNRRTVDTVSDLCFCPTHKNMENLINEGKPQSTCFVTGNTVIDALRYTTKGIKKEKHDKLRILITAHRRENLGNPIRNILRGVLHAADKYQNAEFIFPVHPNPLVKQAVSEILKNPPGNLRLTDPMNVFSFHRLLSTCDIVLTDSGGLQEEATALNIPLILARNITERPEAEEMGGMILSGTDEKDIFSLLCRLIDDPSIRAKMSSAPNPFGDGKASKKIADIIESYINKASL